MLASVPDGGDAGRRRGGSAWSARGGGGRGARRRGRAPAGESESFKSFSFLTDPHFDNIERGGCGSCCSWRSPGWCMPACWSAR